MLKYMDLLQPYGMYWYVTITPYGKEIEPMVPDKEHVLLSFQKLSEIVGIDSIGWRYDPIVGDDTYTADYHIRQFTHIASVLSCIRCSLLHILPVRHLLHMGGPSYHVLLQSQSLPYQDTDL